VSGKHYLLAEGDISAPIYWRTDAPRAITIGGPMVSHLLLADRTEEVKKKVDQTVWCALAYFQANRLLTELYKQETEIC
jgi:hypothetical protein